MKLLFTNGADAPLRIAQQLAKAEETVAIQPTGERSVFSVYFFGERSVFSVQFFRFYPKRRSPAESYPKET